MQYCINRDRRSHSDSSLLCLVRSSFGFSSLFLFLSLFCLFSENSIFGYSLTNVRDRFTAAGVAACESHRDKHDCDLTLNWQLRNKSKVTLTTLVYRFTWL